MLEDVENEARLSVQWESCVPKSSDLETKCILLILQNHLMPSFLFQRKERHYKKTYC